MSYTHFGIPMVDLILPEGYPRNSFVLLSGEGGTGKSVALLQIVGAKLAAGEPCIFITFDDSPESVLENMKRLGFDYESALKADLLHIVDGFSFRSKIPHKENDSIKNVPNPRDHHELTRIILSAVDGFQNRGSVFIDSLTELFTMSEPSTTIETIKDWRALLCKTMGMTVYASYHVGVKAIDEFADMLEYVVDGILEFRFDPLFAQQGFLARELRIKKMKGSTFDTVWHYFIIEKSGLAIFKPQVKASSEDSHKLSK
ncbi:MAG: RAD55 family ATPase [Candidatus Methanomethylicus sp.]|nr:RAD55 family ATPase [Candidatus Methanomethylicus sp.]